MAKGRLIPVSIYENARYHVLSHMAREMLIGLIVHADDQGRLNGHPGRLRGDIFTYDDISFDDIRKVRNELEENEWIWVYSGDTQNELIQIVDWWKFQSLQWAQASDYPAPAGWADRIRMTFKGEYVEQNWSDGDYARALQVLENDPSHVQVDAPGGQPTPSAQVDAPGEHPTLSAQVDAPGGKPRRTPQVDAPGGKPRRTPQVDNPGGVPKPKPKPKSKPESSSSSSSSSEPERKTSDDDAADEELAKLLRAAGVTAKNQKSLLKGGFRLADVLAELARCHDPDSKVQKPHVITPMNLLKGDFPDATCYDATYWERHIPDAILGKAGLAEYVQEKAQEERGAVQGDYQPGDYEKSDNEAPPIADPNIPEKYRGSWEAARGQLQLEMPKAAYDTWVQDAQLVSVDDGIFRVGVKNAYAQNWLESRLKSTLTRLVTGFMGQKFEVEFVVQ